MRVGILFVVEWLTRGTVAGLGWQSTRREIEQKLGTEPPEDTLVRYGDLEVYYEREGLDVVPHYLMVDLYSHHVDRFRQELPFLRAEAWDLADAIATLRSPLIARALEARGTRCAILPPPRKLTWFSSGGRGSTFGCTFGEPDLEGAGITLFLTPGCRNHFALLGG